MIHLLSLRFVLAPSGRPSKALPAWADEIRRLLLGFSRKDTPELILVFGSKIPHSLRDDGSIWALFLPVPASFILCVARRYGSTVKSRFESAVRLPRNDCVLHWYRHLGIMIARKQDDGLLTGTPAPLPDLYVPCSYSQRPPEEHLPKQSVRFTLMQGNQAC
jgi:hypothetical protein